ncbi:DEAD/DEAH box helicase [Yaniella halotolerans]|uniref:DEAD/DEAH box helicase n=1 Tax=Yaniella halotolerans TaxID=225453 RepID=UPI0003B6184C|nr:DEAD/DEAH box helicase [Yaniella halotolerans]
MCADTPDHQHQDLSPSERYAASRRRAEFAKTELGKFSADLKFPMDGFQYEAAEHLEDGHAVLVAAPTGAGKTVVAEFAIHLALAQGKKAFYTTPIKALSNQKYTDLVDTYGSEKVGLLTGDTSRNPHAQIVVMTTEVLRNMLYAESDTLENLGYVVMDEVHYLADRHRGAVWEEVIIHLPESVQLVALSATVSNAEEFGAWLDTVRGSTTVVVSEHRPVPLWQHVMVGRDLYDLFSMTGDQQPTSQVNPELAQLAELARRDAQSNDWGRPGSRSRNRQRTRGGRRQGNRRQSDFSASRNANDRPQSQRKDMRVSRPQMIRTLSREGLLPCIGFIFSRNGCEAAVEQCLNAGLDLTTDSEKRQILETVDRAATVLAEQDRDALGFWNFRDSLRRGFASHHAGLLPLFKEIVEELFATGLVKAVFATETLALGINMPARTVVIERLVKFDGESHKDITPGEYTQLTGRAGRRGIDVEGHAVVMWQPGLDPSAVAGLAARRTYPLNSSFKPTYNMAVNLLASFGRERSRNILESSFAQFQADRSVVGVAQEVQRQERSLTGYEEAMECHLGDFTEYARLRQEVSKAEKAASRSRNRVRRRAIMESLNKLAEGDIIDVQGTRNLGTSVVVSAAGNPTNPRVGVVTSKGQLRRLSTDEMEEPVIPFAGVELPRKLLTKSPKHRKNIAGWMHGAISQQLPPISDGKAPVGFRYKDEHDLNRLEELRAELHAHPCHGCPDREQHQVWANRWNKLRVEADKNIAKIQGRTNTIARTFDRIINLLTDFGYVENDRITEPGQSLRRIYGDRDLLVSLLLQSGLMDDMAPEDLAGFAALLVFESSAEEQIFQPAMPTQKLQEALDTVDEHWYNLQQTERQADLVVTAQPHPGLVWPIVRWARGHELLASLTGADMAAGDFVRWARQVMDLLGQLASLDDTHPDLARRCRRARDLVNRGIISYSSTVKLPHATDDIDEYNPIERLDLNQ